MRSLSNPSIFGRSLAAGTAVVLAISMVASGIMGLTVQAAGNDTMYIIPKSGAYAVGQNVVVELRANSNSEQVNAVQFEMGYSSNMQFISIETTGSAYNVDAQKNHVNGKVVVARGSTTPLTGDKLVAIVNLRVMATGTGNLQTLNSSVLVNSAENKNIVDTRSGGTLQFNPISSPSARPGPPGPAGKPYVTTKPVPKPAPGSTPTVSVTPNPTPATPTPSPIVLPDDSEFEVEEPGTVEVTPSGEREVEKIEYYINGKLKATVNEPPYTYSVDSSNMRNGKYTLVVKTYYKDGSQPDESTQELNVKNPLNAKQIMLQLQHYAWLIILLLLIIGGLVWFLFFRNRGGNDFGDGYGDYGSGDGGYDPYAVPPPPADPNLVPPTDPNVGGNPNDPYGRY